MKNWNENKITPYLIFLQIIQTCSKTSGKFLQTKLKCMASKNSIKSIIKSCDIGKWGNFTDSLPLI